MGNIDLQLSNAGYTQFRGGEELIQKILAEGDARHLKAIPYLIYRYMPNLKILYENSSKDILDTLINYTKRITVELGIPMNLPDTEVRKDLGYEEFRNEFIMQLSRSKAASPQQAQEQRREEAARSHLFTRKEREILRKIESNKPLTKTEYEYYSRKTKKKLESIMLLEDGAKILLTKSPRRI